MVDYMEKKKIIERKERGLSNREVARQTGWDRDTVSKYWNTYRQKLRQLAEPGADTRAIQDSLLATPKYNSSNRTRRKYTEELDKRLKEILKEEERKTRILGPHKQKLTNKQIHQKLVSEGFDIGAVTINIALADIRKRQREVFIRQEYDLGDRLEYDFGEVKLDCGEKPGAVRNSVALKSIPRLKVIFDTYYVNQPKRFIAIFLENKELPINEIIAFFERETANTGELNALDVVKPVSQIIVSARAFVANYATALGIAACMKGYSVLFATAPNLIIELKEAMHTNKLSAYRKKFERYHLVILDELGYVSMDKAGCETLFNLISSRNEKGSIIATSNLTFDRWEEVFKDPTLTGAFIDRLAHKAHVLDISREKGGRFEETIAWLEETKR